MPDISTSVEHLADLELYKTEKPYAVILRLSDWNESIVTNNLQFKRHENIIVKDIRGKENEFTLDTQGFTILQHKSSLSQFETWDAIRSYQKETEEFLTNWFAAEQVVTYDVKLRENKQKFNPVKDLKDWTTLDRPAQGAHNDVTYGSGPTQIDAHLPDNLKEKYLQKGYRFRIINTWRTINAVLEDNPLALCDFQSIDKEDLIACDRVIPIRAGEVYYLRHNPKQQWYWMEFMTSEEPFLFIMYDSAPGDQARYCPHVPIQNPRASPTAPNRRSIETRSIIITKMPTNIDLLYTTKMSL